MSVSQQEKWYLPKPPLVDVVDGTIMNIYLGSCFNSYLFEDESENQHSETPKLLK